jgi:hypothetical protein
MPLDCFNHPTLEMPQVISANRLTDGIIVFLGVGDAWVERLAEAKVLHDEAELKAAMARATADVAASRVVEVAAFEVEVSGLNIRPKHLRDRIRAAGPTVHPDHGKQAAG